jgi:hypothetical protein
VKFFTIFLEKFPENHQDLKIGLSFAKTLSGLYFRSYIKNDDGLL